MKSSIRTLVAEKVDGKVESLNAAIASAVLMYEAQRQRRNIER